MLKAGAEGRTQLQHGSEYQPQPQRSTNLPKDLGATQVRPPTEEYYRNPTRGGTGFSSFQSARPTQQSASGERDIEGEQYGRRGPDMPKGSEIIQGQGLGGQRYYDSREECTKQERGGIGFAMHRDADGPHLYEMGGVGQRELGRGPLAHRVYSPAPAATGGASTECMKHGPGDIGVAAYRDVDGPHLYEMEGAGRREEGRFMKGYEGAAKDVGDMKGQ